MSPSAIELAPADWLRRYNTELLEIVSALRERQNIFSGWRARMGAIRALVENRWSAVFAGDERDMLEPMVRNIFRYTIEDGGRLFAEALPSERVFAANRRDGSKAEDRELALTAYTQRSGTFDILEWHGQDMIASGLTGIKVWPRRFSDGHFYPTFRRLDPFKILPEPRWAPDKPVDNVMVHYTETVRRLEREYPAAVQDLMERVVAAYQRLNKEALSSFRASGYDLRKYNEEAAANPIELECVDVYSSRYVARIAIHEDNERGITEAVVLSAGPNETGICPVQLGYRPTWSTEPLGDLDDVRGIVRTKNRYMRLLLDYFIDTVYGGKLAWNVQNPHDKGPGTVYRAFGPDAKMDPVTPQTPSFQALQILGLLEDESHGPANPAARGGEVDLNKATAAFLTRAQGPLQSTVRSIQRNFAVAKRRANEAAFAQDEAWCDTRKTITGVARGRRYQLTYTPSETIKGDHANIVTYGTASGMDAPTHQVIVNQKVGLGLMPRELAMEQDPSIDDVPAAMAMMWEQQLADALVAGFAMPDVPLEQRAEAWRQFRSAEDPKQALDNVITRVQSGAPAPAVPGGAPAPTSPGAPPGVPGAEGNALQGLALPPLATLRRIPRRG